jgi:hypothetical protein
VEVSSVVDLLHGACSFVVKRPVEVHWLRIVVCEFAL